MMSLNYNRLAEDFNKIENGMMCWRSLNINIKGGVDIFHYISILGGATVWDSM